MENTQSSFESIPLQPQFDEGPGKYRIGLVLLSSDYATERDFMNMRDNDDIIFYSTRIPLAGEITVESLATSAAELTSATKLLQPGGRLDVLAYSCTSASVVLGHTRVEQAMQLARPGIPCGYTPYILFEISMAELLLAGSIIALLVMCLILIAKKVK